MSVLLKSPTRRALLAIRREVDSYTQLLRAQILVEGGKWDDIIPMRKGSRTEQFRFYLNRFEALLKLKSSNERDLALVVARDKLSRLARNIEEKND